MRTKKNKKMTNNKNMDLKDKTIKKISKLRSHEYLKDEIEIRKDYYEIIRKYFIAVDNFNQISYMYGENSKEEIKYGKRIKKIECKLQNFIFNDLNIGLGLNDCISIMEAYDFGKPEKIKVKFELKDIFTKELFDLEKIHLGYIFHYIVKEIDKNVVDLYIKYHNLMIDHNFIKRVLTGNNEISKKYAQIKRVYTIDSILN